MNVEFLNTEPARIEGTCDDCGLESLAVFSLSAVFGGGMKDYGPIVFCIECEDR